MTNPPIKKPITAIREGNCRSESPDIACPEVQPPAYLVPKPTKNPPKTKRKIPLSEKINSGFVNSSGKKPEATSFDASGRLKPID